MVRSYKRPMEPLHPVVVRLPEITMRMTCCTRSVAVLECPCSRIPSVLIGYTVLFAHCSCMLYREDTYTRHAFRRHAIHCSAQIVLRSTLHKDALSLASLCCRKMIDVVCWMGACSACRRSRAFGLVLDRDENAAQNISGLEAKKSGPARPSGANVGGCTERSLKSPRP